MALDLASSGLGTQGLKAGARAAKAGVHFAKKAFSKEQKGQNTLMKTEGKTGGGVDKKVSIQPKKEQKTSDMTPEEMRRYFEQYKDDPVPVRGYQKKENGYIG
ncbi:hypothetical protein P618_200230 [Holospora obtusa F1]|uniref:Uncharacterized protein n=1 Tax=Holospora obtusa F1 TaxID=1399147 RepID=W6THW7_HOLOB|nr:hypothetical protein P618_200230 [Holospora obtusa F1]